MELKPWWVKLIYFQISIHSLVQMNEFMNAAFLQFWLFKQKPESLDPQAKYHSLTSGLGYNYTQPHKV